MLGCRPSKSLLKDAAGLLKGKFNIFAYLPITIILTIIYMSGYIGFDDQCLWCLSLWEGTNLNASCKKSDFG